MRVLFYAFYFPPAPEVGAKRAAAMHDALVAGGFKVEVRTSCRLTYSDAKSRKKRALNSVQSNPELQRRLPKSGEVLRTRNFGLKVSSYFRSIDKTILSNYFFRNTWRLIRGADAPVDIVLATYKPSANLMLAWMAAKRYRAILIVDLRDLVSIFGRKKSVPGITWVDQKIDKFLIKKADKIIVVSPTQKAKAEKFYGRDVALIYNGTDSAEEERITARPDINEKYIFYSGTLSPDRELASLSLYLEKYNKTRQKPLKLYVASSQDPTRYGGQSSDIVWLGYIPRNEVKMWMSHSEAVVLLEGRESTAAENIPAKLFEYLGVRKKIIADCYKKSDVVDIINATRCGAHVANFQEFCEVMESEPVLCEAAMQRFTRKTQMKEFIMLLRQYVNKK